MKYTIISATPSIDQNTGQQYTDQYGNRSFSVFLKDEQGQTTNILKRVKQGNPDPKAGDILEGTLEMKTGKTGKNYFVFVAEKKEFGGFGGGKSSDVNSFFLSYAKDIVVAMIAHQPEAAKLDSSDIKDDITTLSFHFKSLYEELKAEKVQTTTQPQQVAQNTPQGETEDKEIDINEIPF